MNRIFVFNLVGLLLCCPARNSWCQEAPSSSLPALSDNLAQITLNMMQSVVTITADTYATEDQVDGVFAYADRGEPDSGQSSSLSNNRVTGSGLIVSPDGYIVTNAHVVFGAHHVMVAVHPESSNEQNVTAKIVGIDRTTDVAVLRIPGDHLPFVDLDNSAEAKQGEISLAIGAPLGMENSVTMGVVSNVNRQLSRDDPRRWIQTDATINPGNSGGPLVNARGKFLGMNTLLETNSGYYQGISLAIPASTVRSVFHDVVQFGKVRRVSLGISAMNIDSDIASALHLGDERGVLVQDVDQPSAADKAGVQSGDVVQDVGGRQISTVIALEGIVEHLSPGVSVTLHIWRSGKSLTLHCTPEFEYPKPLPISVRISPRNNLIRRLQIFAVTLDANASRQTGPTRFPHGVVVAARSSTFRAGWDVLEPGDIIYEVNGISVGDIAELRIRLGEITLNTPIVLQIERRNQLRFVEVRT
jgi:serine protease Do